jgi:hypothetical protein
MASGEHDDHDGPPGENIARMHEALARARQQPGWLVVLGLQRQPPPAGERLAALADGLKIDPYTAGQWLRLPGPRVVRREDTERQAARWASWMQALGVRGFAIEAARLAAFAPRDVVQLEQAPGRLVFRDAQGRELAAGAADAFCLVAGDVRRLLRTEQETSDFFLGAVGTGGQLARAEVAHLVDIHFPGAGGTLRVDSRLLDFARAFPGQQAAPDAQMPRVLGLLRARYAAAPLRNSFAGCLGALEQGRRLAGTSVEVGVSLGRPGAVVRSTRTRAYETDVEGAFGLYSALTAADELAGG